MTAIVGLRPLVLAGIPANCWMFGIRIWIAIVIALGVSFWLELESPASAAITVAILALPTRGQALEKAAFRFAATIIGVAASIAIVGLLSQARDLMLVAFVGWIGLCVYVAGMLDGHRAYAAVLSGYTVAIVAIQQIDTPGHVFETGMARGAAIVVGIVSIAIVNDILISPDSHPQLASRIAAIHCHVRGYSRAVLRDGVVGAAAAAGLFRDITALRADITSLAAESTTGSTRRAAARNAIVALVAQLHAARMVGAMPAPANSALRERMASLLEEGNREPPPASLGDHDRAALTASLAWALDELLRRDGQVRLSLAAMAAGTRLPWRWRAPPFTSQKIALEAGARSAIHLGLAAAILVLAGWSAASASLALVAVLIGLGATTPNPHRFAAMAMIATPIAAFLAGVLEFLVLGGVTEFPLLAIGLAPFISGRQS